MRSIAGSTLSVMVSAISVRISCLKVENSPLKALNRASISSRMSRLMSWLCCSSAIRRSVRHMWVRDFVSSCPNSSKSFLVSAIYLGEYRGQTVCLCMSIPRLVVL